MDSFNMNEVGNFVKEISINNCENRELVTNVSILNEVSKSTKANIQCKGTYVPLKEINSNVKPLYLIIEAKSKESIIAATNEIFKLMEQKTKFFEDNVFIKFPTEIDFDIRSKLRGKNNVNFKYITKVCGGAKVLVKGRGLERDPFYINIISTSEIMLKKTRANIQSLIKRVKINHEKFVNEKEAILRTKEEAIERSSEKLNPLLKTFFFPGYKQRLYPNIDPQYMPNIMDFVPENFQNYKSNVDDIDEMIDQNIFENDKMDLS